MPFLGAGGNTIYCMCVNYGIPVTAIINLMLCILSTCSQNLAIIIAVD